MIILLLCFFSGLLLVAGNQSRQSEDIVRMGCLCGLGQRRSQCLGPIVEFQVLLEKLGIARVYGRHSGQQRGVAEEAMGRKCADQKEYVEGQLVGPEEGAQLRKVVAIDTHQQCRLL